MPGIVSRLFRNILSCFFDIIKCYGHAFGFIYNDRRNYSLANGQTKKGCKTQCIVTGNTNTTQLGKLESLVEQKCKSGSDNYWRSSPLDHYAYMSGHYRPIIETHLSAISLVGRWWPDTT